MFDTYLNSDLKKMVQVQHLSGSWFSKDNGGNRINVEVTDNGVPAVLSGTVTGFIVRSNKTTVSTTGRIDGNKVSIVLPETAYDVPGPIAIVIKIAETTVGACTGYVHRSLTETII